MSRWHDTFNNHPFRSVWNQIKEALATLRLSDETVDTSVQELARLRKAVAYIDGLLKNTDPELIPPSTWDSFHSQCTAALSQINEFKNNLNIGHLQNTNGHIDNLLTYLRPYVATPTGAINALLDSTKAYTGSIEEYLSSFRVEANDHLLKIRTAKAECASTTQYLSEQKNKIDELINEVFSEGDEGIKNRLHKFAEEISEHAEEINSLYNEALVGDDDSPSTKQELSRAKKEADALHAKIKETLESAENEVKGLKSFYTKIFGALSEDGERKGGLSQELEDRSKQLTAFEVQQKTKYEALNSQIESLLPGATSAGLASSYRTMKESFDTPIRNMSKLFFMSIGALIISSLLILISKIGWFFIEFHPIQTLDEIGRSVLTKLPIFAPIVWLAFYASKRRSEYHRLQQEYAHKESLAASYESYKIQISELGTDNQEMQRMLITKAIDAISHNASQTLDGKHGDKMPIHEIIEKVSEAASSAISRKAQP